MAAGFGQAEYSHAPEPQKPGAVQGKTKKRLKTGVGVRPLAYWVVRRGLTGFGWFPPRVCSPSEV
jgi:hypothetical protein